MDKSYSLFGLSSYNFGTAQARMLDQGWRANSLASTWKLISFSDKKVQQGRLKYEVKASTEK